MVIYWTDENQDRVGEDTRPLPTVDNATLEERSVVRPSSLLFVLAQIGNWDEFLSHLERLDPAEIRDTARTWDPLESGDSILHAAVYGDDVPLTVIQGILEMTSEDDSDRSTRNMTSIQNRCHQTPLHVAVMNIPTRSDVIQCLYDADHETALIRDDRQLRPIDEITTKIIMMEEVLKYTPNDDRMIYEQKLDSLWASASVLVGAAVAGSKESHATDSIRPNENSTLLVHACIQSRDVPFALTERAMKNNMEQLSIPDRNGDLPLHLVSRIPPRIVPVLDDSRGENEETSRHDDDEGDFLQRVSDFYPGAACTFNQHQQLPISVAIQAGRLWHSGVFQLLQANPDGIQEVCLPPVIYPYLFQRLARHPDLVYLILQSMQGMHPCP